MKKCLSDTFPNGPCTKSTINKEYDTKNDAKRQRDVGKQICKNKQESHSKINHDHEDAPH